MEGEKLDPRDSLFFFSMEETGVAEDQNSDQLLDAGDQFSFFNCSGNAESGKGLELLKLKIIGDGADQVLKAKHSSEYTFPYDLGRRSSFCRRSRGSSRDAKDSNSDSPVISEISNVSEAITPAEKRSKILFTLKSNKNVRGNSDSPWFRPSSVQISNVDEQDGEYSIIKSADKERFDELAIGYSHKGDFDQALSNFLVFLAGLMIKAIGFQFSFWVSFFTFPIWLSYCSLMIMINPFRTIKWAKGYLTAALLRMLIFFCESVSSSIYERLQGQKSIGKLIVRICWGLFWSVYTCFMLFGILVSAFVMGGFMMRYLVEEPVQRTETLNFDYTKSSPVAFVPIVSCPGVACGMNCEESIDVGKVVGSHVILPNHKLQLIISLMLPESEYNRNLGVFQVKVDFLSANGKVISSSRYTSMLQFKSQPIRFLETFLKTFPLIAGYTSESQILNLKMRGFTEEREPPACLRVVLEQRAEYGPGAGIPEIYAASMVLESELPLFKRIIWCWRKTTFVWISMISFMMELMLILVCCRPIIIPRARPKDGSQLTAFLPKTLLPSLKAA